MFEMQVGIALQGNRPREPYSGLNVQMPSALLLQMLESPLECLGIVMVSVAGGAEIDERYGIPPVSKEPLPPACQKGVGHSLSHRPRERSILWL